MHALIAVLLLTAGEPEPPAVVTEEIVLACKGVTCTDDGPKDEWDLPSCVDESLHDALIENARHGDRSAVELLRGRYDLATTHRERHRIAVELLGRVTNDRIYWHDLESYARIAVRFPKGEEGDLPSELERYCAERNLDPYELWDTAWNALNRISEHRRSRELLLQALETTDVDLLTIALHGLATQRDPDVLPAIEKALDREARNHPWLVDVLAFFRLPEADALAFRYYVDETDRDGYRRFQAEINEPR